MRNFNTIVKTAALCSASYIGYIYGHYGSNYENFKSNKAPLYPGLPLYGTVSAATPQNSVVKFNASNDVPELPPTATRTSQIMRFGFPSLSNIRSLDDYVISYDTRSRVPYWVFEHLTSSSVAKNDAVSREKSDFREDKSVHEYFRSRNSDFKGSGFDRGHLAAAGNHRKCQKDCDDTFLLSNMAPQVGRGFNRDKWNDLERYCRKLVFKYKNVYVCTGPLYLPRRENDGKLYVKYQVIGQNNVAVPTHFFKIVVCEDESGVLEMESFLLPNEKIEDATPIETFLVSPEIVERASGLLFFDKINRSKLKKINRQKIGWI